MQATERKNATQRPKPGRPGRYESEYIRHGTQSLLASFDIITGWVVAHCGATRTADDLLAFMEQVASECRAAKKIVVVWDNLNIHHDGRSQRWTEFNERHGGKFDFRVYSEEEGIKSNRVRFSRVDDDRYQLGFATHRGTWEQTPFEGSLSELVLMLVEQFALTLEEF